MRNSKNRAFAQLADFSSGKSEPPDYMALVNEAREQAEFLATSAREHGFQEGYEAGLEKARQDAEIAQRDLLATFDQQLDEARRKWLDEFASRMLREMESGLNEVSESIQTVIAHLVEPWLLQHLHRQALDEFKQALERSLVDGCKIEISGSEDMCRWLTEKFSGRKIEIKATVNDSASVQAKVDNTILEANFSAWIDKLRGLQR